MDTVSAARRSEIMANVRSAGNRATEGVFVSLLRKHRIKGWRRHTPLFGKPDFVFRSSRLAIFIDGCFWHGCRVHCRLPSSNGCYWVTKIERNRRRDKLVNHTLRLKGWQVLRIWEHDLATANQLKCVARVRRAIVTKSNKG